MENPKITVLLPVYNAGAYVQATVKSLLEQTFREFELLIIDDGSLDDTVSQIKKFDDPRIRFITNDGNLGVASTLNRGIETAKAPYVARMDSDDICHPHRLEMQFRFMEENSEVGVLGTWIRYFGKQLPVVEKVPCDSDVIRSYLLFDNPIFHPSAMLRKPLLDKYGLRYDGTFNRSEDFHLWIRAANHFPLANLPYPLLRYRCHETSITNQAAAIMKLQVLELLKKGLDALGVALSNEQLQFHYAVSKGEQLVSLAKLQDAESWLALLVKNNDQHGAYPQKAFKEAVGLIWNRLCFNATHLGLAALRMHRSSDLAKGARVPSERYLRFLVSLAVRPFIDRERAE